jgi:uncharacterized protein (TIGR02265 family)
VNGPEPSQQPLSPERAAQFALPDPGKALDVEEEVARIPEEAAIKGMFIQPMAEEAARLGRVLPSARERYVGFKFYPMREHVRVMFEAAEVFFPNMSPARALRKLGRGATPALLTSTLGRVVWSTAMTPHLAIEALAKSYAINLKPGTAQVIQKGPGYAIVELRDVHYLIDSNHVGAFENVLRGLDIQPEVKVRLLAPGHGELLLTWR